jgi:hypothetical protein
VLSAGSPAPSPATAGQQILVRSDGTIAFFDPPTISAAAWGVKPSATATVNMAGIASAIAALPLGPDGVSRLGTVDLPTGILNVSSFARADTGCTYTAGSATILDSHITALDQGGFVLDMANQADNGAVILTVNPGVSFTINRPIVSSGTTLTVVRPAIQGATAMTLRGRGRKGGITNVYSAGGHCTLIQDNGNGVTIAGPNGVDGAANSAWQFTIEHLSCNGPGNTTGNASSNNIYGFYCTNLAALFMTQCDFEFHGRWGVFLDQNTPVAGVLRDMLIQYNGTAAATIPTGGLWVSVNEPNEVHAVKVRCLYNFGWGAQLAGNQQCDSCVFGATFMSAYVDGTHTLLTSGFGAVIAGGSDAPVILNNVEWQDNAGQAVFYVMGGANLHITGGGGYGDNVQPYAIIMENGLQSSLTIDGVAIHGHTTADVYFIGLHTSPSNPPRFSWRNCYTLDPLWATFQGGVNPDLPASAAQAAVGTYSLLMGDGPNWTNLTLATSVVSRGTPAAPTPQAMVDPFGNVRLRGCLTGTSIGAGGLLATIPATDSQGNKLRPAYEIDLGAIYSQAAPYAQGIVIAANGQITVGPGGALGASNWVSLDGVSFNTSA